MHHSLGLSALFVLGGFILLIGGADLLVRGASRLATRWGVSPIVVGLTIVAFGTSAPELLVSLTAAVKGEGDIALGNVLGSNLFNTLVVIGVAAVLRPIEIHQRYLRKELPTMLAVTAALWLALGDHAISRIEGAVGVAAVALFVYASYRSARREPAEVTAEYAEFVDGSDPRRLAISRNVAYVLGGSAALALGGSWLVDGATALARAFGVTERFIAVTLIAVGTSLPELATTVVASLRGERGIAVANAIGSNIFNILLILGLPAVIHPIAAGPNLVRFDLPAVAAAGALLVPIFVTDCRVSRLEGWGMIALYGAYITMLATGSLGG